MVYVELAALCLLGVVASVIAAAHGSPFFSAFFAAAAGFTLWLAVRRARSE
jgi:hypothetical protein